MPPEQRGGRWHFSRGVYEVPPGTQPSQPGVFRTYDEIGEHLTGGTFRGVPYKEYLGGTLLAPYGRAHMMRLVSTSRGYAALMVCDSVSSSAKLQLMQPG